MSCQVAIYVFDHVEVLDFAGPYEVFTTAARVHGRREPGLPAPFQVATVARTRDPVRARAGLVTVPDHGFSDCPELDLLIVPGGVVNAELARPEVIDWIRSTAARTPLVASVCTGAFLLAKAGLLSGRRVTTHWEDIADLRAAHPDLTVVDDQRWVDEGAIVTSAGIAAGIDMSLHLVARLVDPELAAATARQMDVPWRPEP